MLKTLCMLRSHVIEQQVSDTYNAETLYMMRSPDIKQRASETYVIC